MWCKSSYTYFIEYKIRIIDFKSKLIVDEIDYNTSCKRVYIWFDSNSLGDNLGWIPYVEEFRKKHNCIMYCSTFFNYLFKDIYPDINFVEPGTSIHGLYAAYPIGCFENKNGNKVKWKSLNNQEICANILGLKFEELIPPLKVQNKDRKIDKKYVCISEYASHENKHWKYNNGWQIIVDYLNSIDYDVYVISKEPTTLNNVINLTGNISLIQRAQTLRNTDFFIGLSSGLSWLSWAVNTHVFMISDVTPPHHEFKSNITRICANNDMLKIDYNAPNITSPDIVIDNIKNYLKLKDIY
jgi:autotransporter strand-loop-strand O-heptosyltransferase